MGLDTGETSAARGLLIEGRTVAGEVLSARRLEACDTAGWKPVGNLRYSLRHVEARGRTARIDEVYD